jgi:hypothetical protein
VRPALAVTAGSQNVMPSGANHPRGHEVNICRALYYLGIDSVTDRRSPESIAFGAQLHITTTFSLPPPSVADVSGS